jgi:glyceraldehyde 3-phosphate dehydrogenase
VSGAVPIGLMGLGRIARNLFRLLYRNEEFPITAVSDPADPEALTYLLRFDTLLGRFPEAMSLREGKLQVAGRSIPLLGEGDAGDVPWAELGVHTVIEAMQEMPSRDDLERHLEAGAKRVILCVPPSDEPDITVVMGVNDGDLRAEQRIVSNASNTAHAAAPILHILDAAFGVERAFLNTVHAYSDQQRLADVPDADPRRGRAAAENIIPQQTNAGQVIREILPELDRRVTASALNVPVPDGSVVDLVCWHREPISAQLINDTVRAAIEADWQGLLEYEDDPIVSSDVRMSSCSGIFDSAATMTLGENVSKTLTWFDNGWGYAHRVVDLLRRFHALDEEVAR